MKSQDKRKQTKPKKSHGKTTSSSAKPSRSQRKGITNEQIEQTLLKLFGSEPNKVFNYKQVCALFGKTTMAQKRQVVSVLETLTAFRVLEEIELGRYRLAREKAREATGEARTGYIKLQGRQSFFIPEAGGDPEPLEERALGVALSGDYVRVALNRGLGRRQPPRLEVVKILKRSERTYVGQIQFVRGKALFHSESRELRVAVAIAPDLLEGARSRDKVVVQILGWSPRDRNPQGKVVSVLGQSGHNDAEMHAILAEYGLPYDYPQEVEQAAELLSGEITAEELKVREDFRDVVTFTIDPRDAKDFDDALSLRRLPSGLWEVGIHIADVSHFVHPGDLIDQEAERRATSVYLVDRTIPMLPERLSNNLCSLRPQEEKYSYSCVCELDEQANVKASRIVRTVIRSDRRFTYEEAQEIIEQGKGEYQEEILTLHRLAQQLRERRFKAGSIAFEQPEVRFLLDEAGKPLSVYIKESKEANQLIEEFMLLANRTVAERIGRRRGQAQARPFVYRVHDAPDTAKLMNLSTFASRLGYTLKVGDTPKTISTGLNKFLGDIKGQAEDGLFSTLAVRAMAKASYTTENIGHYGLAFKYYSHFTSPIRRYPDLMAHRLLTHYLIEGGKTADIEHLEEQCKHASAMEALAAQAERSSIRYKQVEYLRGFLGHNFEGVISGVAEWGIYVELCESKCEGLIPMRDLDNDYYEYDEKNYCLVGRHYGERFTVGDKLTVKVAQANLEKRQIDFAYISRAEDNPQAEDTQA